MPHSQQVKHITAIKKYMEVIINAQDMHAVIVEGAPGWGKTTAVERALDQAGIIGMHLGAYSTPLNLFNFLFEHSARVVIVDDCAGLFNDRGAMAILKAATWPTLGHCRLIKWGSTTALSATSEFEFTGKLVIVCNSFPNTPDGDAIKSRAFCRRVDIELSQAKKMILNAAQDERWYRNTDVATEVAEFLVKKLNKETLPHVSFRTLKKGYRLAEIHADSWQELLQDTLPSEKLTPEELVKKLSKEKIKVEEQAKIFQEKTGFTRRTFFYYRTKLGLGKK